ncbi:hypothetical protein CPC16_008877 [Podila verticillata]|nr:hypothetical protein BGZ52_000783 [Haplosporangium bisporale]KAF9205029.1 hypothetical protein BGZ59_000722 [Podila verticillata]KAF9383531.1 hypothetical protein CPC16_008877 [Podila verticillata]KAI9238521.1 MAG: putative secreted lipase [Podila humilis]KFH68115.1 hypothetical protein MVEG_06845 [Podila verticillata NRRL 6337]
MHFAKSLVAAVAFAIASNFVVEASPIPPKAVEAYVPMSERKFTAEEIDHHEGLFKRAFPGVNNWNCKPSKSRPRAVVLVHGLIGSEDTNWVYMSPRFLAEGYCVYALTYGQLPGIPLIAGLDKIETSAGQLSTFIDKVLASTNTTKVDLVGHSQGSLMPRYYLKNLGGATKVNKFAAFGAIAYGTTLFGLAPFLTGLGLYDPIKKIVDPVCKSCFQFLAGSPFLTELNKGGDTVPGVQYKFIASAYDEVVTPWESGFLKDKNSLVQNVKLQNLCALDFAEHAFQMLDPIVFHAVNGFLTPSEDQNVNCLDALR